MRRFLLGSAVRSARLVLAMLGAVPVLAGAAYLAVHPLSNPDHMNRWGDCIRTPDGPVGLVFYAGETCRPPSRFVWQIPAGVLLGLAGIGAFVAIKGERRPRHGLPDGLDRIRLARI